MCIRNSRIASCAVLRPRGFTLIELVMFIVIVSIGIVGILAVLNYTTQKSADPMVRKQVLAIAESLLEEVELMPFTYCDPNDANATTATSPAGCAATAEGTTPQPASETRNSATDPFDNVGDYGGFSMSGIVDITGASISGLSGYSASVGVVHPAGGLAGIASSEVLQITVTVTGPGNESVTLDGYRTRYAPNATQ